MDVDVRHEDDGDWREYDYRDDDSLDDDSWDDRPEYYGQWYDDEQQWYDDLEPYGYDDEEPEPARWYECKHCDGGRLYYAFPCEHCRDTGMRWRWLGWLLIARRYVQAYWNRLFRRCSICGKLEYVLFVEVDKHDDCLPF